MPDLSAKRLYDFSLAGVGLLVLSPLFLMLALAVKLSDGGPIWYRQQRVGRGGRLFWIWKYRTMVVDAERLGLKVTRGNDPRITRL
jgi:lipopolysaccharide/colanic/teichoic acid biosynthesis glycosyltransferase